MFFKTYESGVAAVRPDVVLAHETHGAVELSVEDVDQLGNTVLAVNVGEVEWTSNANGSHAERDESEHVRGVTNTAVGVDLDLAEDFGVVAVEVEQDFDSGNAHVDLTATMVGDVDSRETEVGAELYIVGSLDTLGNNGQVGHLAELVQSLNAGVRGVAGAGRAPVAVVARANTLDAGVVDREEDSAEPVALDAVQLVL